jgi:CRP-like cAMP-binding protein/ATP/ADP translocase
LKTLLQRLFKIEDGEARALGLSLALAVCLGLPRLFTLTVGAALFLERHPAEDIPWVYIAASAVLPAAGMIHLAIGRWFPFVKMQLGTLLVLASVPAAFLVLLGTGGAAWPAFALFVWCGAELHLSNIVLWSTANRMFTVRQGKRLFGLVGSGEIVAAIAGGAAIPLLTRLLGAVGLLWLSVVGFLLASAVLVAMARAFPDRLSLGPDRRGAARAGRRELFAALRERFVLLIFLTYALVLSAGFFVNSIFYFQVRETFPSATAVAVFLGQLAALTSLVSLAFRALLSSRLLVRFGLVGGLVATPAALLAASLAVVWAGRGGTLPARLFACVVAMRLLERLLTGSLGQPAYYSLYQPLSPERRARVQTAAETIAGPVVGGLTGAVLLFLTKGLELGAVGLTSAFLPVLLVWLAVSAAVGRTFPTALTAALRRRGLSGSDLSVTDAVSLRVLERGLSSPRAPEVLHCLRLLEDAEHPRLGELLTRCAGHPDPAVRGGVYEAIERGADAAWMPFLGERVATEDGETAASLLRAIGACGRHAARPLLERSFAQSAGPAHRGALVALVRDAGAEVDHPASLELERLGRSADEAERVDAARALGEIGGERAIAGLAPLLADPDARVRKAALRSAGRLGDPRLLALAVPSLELPEARGETVRALLSSPETATPVLVAAYQANGASPGLRRGLLQVLGRSRDPYAARFLAGELAFAETHVLSEILWSLHLCRFRASGQERAVLESCFRAEVRRGEQLVAFRRDLRNEPGVELLESALTQELGRTQKRIFLLLSFVHDSEALMRIWSNFSVSPALRDLSIELFESRVDRGQARRALPVLAETSAEPTLPPGVVLRRILFDARPRPGAWIRACAVDALAVHRDGPCEEERHRLLADDAPVVRETARARWPESAGIAGEAPVVDRVRVLRGAGIFREIDDEVLAELAPGFTEVCVSAGDEVGGEPPPDRSILVVSEGLLRFDSPREGSVLLRPGQTFGELSALEPGCPSERATALEPSRLLRLPGRELRDFMSTRIEAVRGIVAVLCQRARSAAPHRRARPVDGQAASPSPAPRPEWVGGGEALSPLDRVLVMKTAEVFSEVPDDILAEVAGRTREVRLRKNEPLFRKGDPGTTMYVVAAGRLRVHVGDRLVAELGERAVVGELAALSSEPRTASVTAADDALLLSLDQESLFDLMLDQQEIAWGIIRVLVGRLVDAPRAGGAEP